MTDSDIAEYCLLFNVPMPSRNLICTRTIELSQERRDWWEAQIAMGLAPTHEKMKELG